MTAAREKGLPCTGILFKVMYRCSRPSLVGLESMK